MSLWTRAVGAVIEAVVVQRLRFPMPAAVGILTVAAVPRNEFVVFVEEELQIAVRRGSTCGLNILQRRTH